MNKVTLRDILDLLTDRMDNQDKKFDRLAKNQESLVDSTNHKVDALRRQGVFIVTAIFIVALPVMIDHWRVLLERAQTFY